MSRRQDPIESLVRVRRHHELRRAVLFAEVERHRLAAEGAIVASGERIASAQEALRRTLEGPLDAALLRLTAHAALVEEHRRRRSLQSLAALAPALERTRAALTDASAHRRAAELLVERHRAERQARQERSEQAALDEAAARQTGAWS